MNIKSTETDLMTRLHDLESKAIRKALEDNNIHGTELIAIDIAEVERGKGNWDKITQWRFKGQRILEKEIKQDPGSYLFTVTFTHFKINSDKLSLDEVILLLYVYNNVHRKIRSSTYEFSRLVDLNYITYDGTILPIGRKHVEAILSLTTFINKP